MRFSFSTDKLSFLSLLLIKVLLSHLCARDEVFEVIESLWNFLNQKFSIIRSCCLDLDRALFKSHQRWEPLNRHCWIFSDMTVLHLKQRKGKDISYEKCSGDLQELWKFTDLFKIPFWLKTWWSFYAKARKNMEDSKCEPKSSENSEKPFSKNENDFFILRLSFLDCWAFTEENNLFQEFSPYPQFSRKTFDTTLILQKSIKNTFGVWKNLKICMKIDLLMPNSEKIEAF